MGWDGKSLGTRLLSRGKREDPGNEVGGRGIRTAIPLGLQGLSWSTLTEKAGNQTRLTGLRMATGNTRLLHLVVDEVMRPSGLGSN